MWDGQVPCHPYDAARIAYVEVPKAGCTSVKWALAPFLGSTEDLDEIHGWTGYTYAQDAAQMVTWLRSRWADYLTFTVVRDPIARFESFYYEKLSPAQRAAYGNISRYVLHHFEADEWRWNPHTVPQTAILGDDLSAFDYVGRVEAMDELEGVLSEHTGTRIRIGHYNRSTLARDPLTPEAEAQLRDIFARDYAVLGYA